MSFIKILTFVIGSYGSQRFNRICNGIIFNSARNFIKEISFISFPACIWNFSYQILIISCDLNGQKSLEFPWEISSKISSDPHNKSIHPGGEITPKNYNFKCQLKKYKIHGFAFNLNVIPLTYFTYNNLNILMYNT
jgi:hypothetical protein